MGRNNPTTPIRLIVLSAGLVWLSGMQHDRACGAEPSGSASSRSQPLTRGEALVSGGPKQPFSDSWPRMLLRDATGRSPSRDARQAAPIFRSIQGKSSEMMRRRRQSTAADSIKADRAPGESPPSARASAPAPAAQTTSLTIGTSFRTTAQKDQINAFASSAFPPNIAAAAGPDHVVELVDGSAAVFNKTGALLSFVTLDSFFTLVDGGTTYPRGGATNARLLFDRHSARWFAAALEFGNPAGSSNHAILAVSRGPNPISDPWDKYLIPIGRANMGFTTFLTDALTFGMDDNGVYFGATIIASDAPFFPTYKIAAVARAGLIAPSPSMGTLYQFSGITDMYGTPQPAHNQDAVGPEARAWFVASSSTTLGNVHYRTLVWSGGVPALSAVSSVLATPPYGFPLNAPSRDRTTNIYITDDRLQAAVIRNARLWTCRSVGVNSTGTAQPAANRTGCEWLEIDVTGATAVLRQSGRIFDSQAVDPRFYYYPAIMVSGQGHVACAFSGSSVNDFVGAFFTTRLATHPPGWMEPPVFLHAGEAAYEQLDSLDRNRWGEYAAASLDPNDDMTIWTVSPYACALAADTWGTWAGEFRAPAPFVSFMSASGVPGQTGLVISLTGAGLFDPGPGFRHRLDVTFSGTGVTVTNLAYVGPTRVDVTVDIAPNAPTGSRTITLTNPDGQTASIPGALTIVDAVQCSSLLGDMSGDGLVDGRDVQGFVDCYMLGDPSIAGCGCADLQRDNVLTKADVTLFKMKVLGFGTPPSACLGTCPGDVDGNRLFDGRDLQRFVACYRAGPFVVSGCPCADVNEDNRVNDADLWAIVDLVMLSDNAVPNCE